MNELPNELIEKALHLTGKSMEDVEINGYWSDWIYIIPMIVNEFSIEKFFYYLLSPKFLLEFSKKHRDKYHPVLVNQTPDMQWHAGILWEHIFLYQNWEEKYLISTLSDVLE